MRTIIEPFRIKMTEPIPILDADQRSASLAAAHQNVFLLEAKDVTIDLLTDSGTGAMSSDQWAALMLGDESYAGSRSWERFESTIREITGLKHIFPTHQGRAAERLLAQTVVKAGQVIPNNSHFDTTRANFEYVGALPKDLLYDHAYDLDREEPFKGDLDIDKLITVIEQAGVEAIPFVMVTVTNNAGGGQPVSMANLKAVREVADRYGLPLILDCCRFAENAYFIQQREDGYADRSLMSIAQEMFSFADGATMSAKKDGLANIGGFFACNNDEWAENFRNLLILTEGFPTYGGLAGRDLEVIAVGLREAVEQNYQVYRHATVSYMHQQFVDAGVPVVRPAGGHAVFLDASRFAEGRDPLTYPGIGVVNELYLRGGIRAVEMGSVMFGAVDAETGEETPAPLELVRLAFPRRVYTQSHFDYIIEVVKETWAERESIPPYRITYQPPFLRHFSAHFEVVS
jgi:tryptophanase